MRRTLNNSLKIHTNMKGKSNSFIHRPIYFELRSKKGYSYFL